MRNSVSWAMNRINESHPLPLECQVGTPLEAETLSFSRLKIGKRSPKAGLPEVIRRILCERGMGISPREVEIICYIMAERKDLFIANEMGISYNTLRKQLSRLFRKLGVHSRTGVVVAVFSEVIRIMGEGCEKPHT